ncbi:Eco57I restriction-modification methylase domain-containing protein [Comamonas sp. 17RB]|uniref:Eco57I restriction-modification methylase domain-containing protein n=1 Tax=Comamonas sp. 17RB TaxID=3047025 RepID=UPI0024B83E13|nr:Eco57I restriction-modification methylase domain-containing protein [Comamonas sp. 17RB]MDI9853994.1 Eco57I restriction-modification methylase domain-containing protein [Comamonas sp. 17RB]
MLHLEHKPFYPTSEFHITIYDGGSEDFAVRLLNLLSKFPWGIRVDLPKRTHLQQIRIKSKAEKSHARSKNDEDFKKESKDLFFSIFNQKLTKALALSLSDDERLTYASKICKNLQKASSGLLKIKVAPDSQKPGAHEIFNANPANAVHLTPPEMARSVVRGAMEFFGADSLIDFGDPAVGTGAFFSALLAEVGSERIRSAIGVDINPDQVQAARLRWTDRGMKVEQTDYLHMEILKGRNLVVANPPYLRHQGIPAKYKVELRQRASVISGRKVSGLSGQYVYFMLLAHQWLLPDAISAWLIPSEFMQTAYGEVIRKYLTEDVELLRIHQYSAEEVYFENAEVLPCVVYFRNRKPCQNAVVNLSFGSSIENPQSEFKVEFSELNQLSRWSIPPKKKKKQEGAIPLGSLFNVKRGVATGANSFFIISRKEAEDLKIHEHYLRPVIPKIRNFQDKIIETAPDGYPDLHPQLCLLHVSDPLDEIKIDCPGLYEYLHKGDEDGLPKRYLLGSRKPWYRQESRDPALFMCTYMGRQSESKSAIKFLWNKSRAIATNTYLMLYPKPALQRLLENSPDYASMLFKSLEQASVDEILELTRSHAGGLTKIEPKDLLLLPLHGLDPEIKDVAESSLFFN